MNGIENLYPATPVNIAPAITEPSASFKREVKKVMGSITLFFIVYLILIALAIALAIGCVLLGIGIMGAASHIIVIIAGVGVMSIGIMVFIFLVKFIFSVKKFDESGSIPVTEQEQPELFGFIRQLTIDTQTNFPKKIVLSPEVNACVFYNDSFWSMFFPVKKNLQIGLGLVNTVTLSEFKAVMAHEFGHFSQRSMKLGGFVYNVNKAIYNMLYENKDYGSFLQTWGSLHWAISIFAWLTIQIVKGIQSILQSMYGFINKNYLSLSREMEFHADAVAASVSGSNYLISALKKLELSNACYEAVLQRADSCLKQNEVLENVYHNHHVIMKQYAIENNLQLKNNIPVLPPDYLNRFQLSKLNIKDQWASHPSTNDREEKLNELKVEAVNDERSAWLLFREPEKVQQQLSSFLYQSVPAEAKKIILNETAFYKKYTEEITSYQLPNEYNGYYDTHQMNEVDFTVISSGAVTTKTTEEQMQFLFSDERVARPKQLLANESDAQLLQAIVDKQIDTKTFDYDGEKYEKEQASVILEKLNGEIKQQKEQVQKDEEENAAFFYEVARQKGEEIAVLLKQMYSTHFSNRKKAEEQFSISQRVIDLLSPLLRGETVSIEAATAMASDLRKESNNLKPLLKEWVENGTFNTNEKLKEMVISFINANYQYFSGDTFFGTELGQLHQLLTETVAELGDVQFHSFKKILQYQLGLLKNAAKEPEL